MNTTDPRPSCPYPCAGSYCPHVPTDPECLACDARPGLEAYRAQLEAWKARQPAGAWWAGGF